MRTNIINTRLKRRVHLDQIHGDQTSSLVDALGDEITLSQCEATADGCAGAGCPHWIESVYVE